MATIVFGALGIAFVVVLYYLVLWARRDARSERAALKMKAQVERMQRGATARTPGLLRVAPQIPRGRSRTPDPAPPPGFQLAAWASPTRGNAGHGVVTTDTAPAVTDGAPAGAGVASRPERRRPLGVPRQVRLFPEAAGLGHNAPPSPTPRLLDGTVT